MAGQKRKVDKTLQAVKSQQPPVGGERATKRRRSEGASHSRDSKPGKDWRSEASSPPKPAQNSILLEEDRAFPRGGGGVLTPLEHKQIQLQASRDALFEETHLRQSKANIEHNSDASDREDDFNKAHPRQKKRRKSKSQNFTSDDLVEPRIRVESLKFNTLFPGMIVLGQIVRIKEDELILDLPNNLSGSASIMEISSQLSVKVEAAADAEEVEGHSVDNDKIDSEGLDLTTRFSVGQWLRASIVSTTDTENTPLKARKRIKLSIEPEKVNAGLDRNALPVNSMIQASVLSVEDHGLVMDLGLKDGSTKGFMSSRDVGEDLKYTDIKEGSVFLCLITGLNSNKSVIKLSADFRKAGDLRKSHYLANAASVNALLPGSAVELLVSQVSESTIAGRIMGLVTATADLFHSRAVAHSADVSTKHKIGSLVKARIICTFPKAQSKTVGISLLDHVLALSANTKKSKFLPVGSFIEESKIIRVEPGLGIFAETGVRNMPGFVHISRLSDNRIESISPETGNFRAGTNHRARVIGHNAVDGLHLLSFEKSILEQEYLRIEDVPLGIKVKGKVDKLVVDSKGRSGLVVNVAAGITGFVQEMHLADIILQHPDRKFKSGMNVSARVLAVDNQRRQLLLTLKKSLVNTELPQWSDWQNISTGDQSIGTIVHVQDAGALIQFYGDVRGFLPVAEMSETFISDPRKHFNVAQVVTVNTLSVDPDAKRMQVSCKACSSMSGAQDAAFRILKIGQIIDGMITEKSAEDVTLELEKSGLRANLKIGHLTDGSERKNVIALDRMRVGQPLKELVVLDLIEKRRAVVLTNKPSFVKAAKKAELIKSFDDVKKGMKVDGFVSGISDKGIFLRFTGGLTGFLHKSNLTDDVKLLPNFGQVMEKSLSAWIISVDHSKRQFSLSLKVEQEADQQATSKIQPNDGVEYQTVINPVDGVSTSITEFLFGKFTKARITSVRATQLNVQLADNVQGRVDVSEAFNNWEEIKDRKHPLKIFRMKQIISVRILGIHDARNHRFLPISHRSGKVPVFELSMKLTDDNGSATSIMSLEQVVVGSLYSGFVNNTSDMCLWVNISPTCRGRIDRVEISDDVSLLNDLEANFPLGSAIRVRATKVDLNSGRLDLSARSASSENELSFDNLVTGAIVPGRVTKITERSLVVQLSGTVVGQVNLTEIADDYDQANTANYNKNDIVKVCVIDVDKSNKRVTLSTRPSKVLSSSLLVKDKSITDVSQLKINDILRGFIKNVADMGLFVSLGPNITAFVRVADMADVYMKDWKANYEIDRLVTGKVIAIDVLSKRLQMSLKASVIDKDYVPRVSFNDLKVGQVVTGKIRKVEDFGAFIVIDNSHNVSGLCHRTEVAERRVDDVRELYSEGDAVKAKILKIQQDKRRISFGLKASYFNDQVDEDTDMEDDEEEVAKRGVALPDALEEDMGIDELLSNGGVQVDEAEAAGALDFEDESNDGDDSKAANALPKASGAMEGLNPGAFDWSGGSITRKASFSASDSNSESSTAAPKKKRRKAAALKVDQTGDLDARGPQSADDFERLLLGSPNSSQLWIQYMAFHLRLSAVETARALAERALNRVHIREQEEKLNIWTAYLNLEAAYGDADTLAAVFKRAKEHADPGEVTARLISIHIASGSHSAADDLFATLTKTKSATADPKLWLNYATFLFDSLGQPDRARLLLPRALQSVPAHLHTRLVARFAALEFRSRHGDPERGRTAFEGLLDAFPKRWALWDMFVDVEMRAGASENVRGLYERMTGVETRLKKRRARFVFKRWLAFEETQGNVKGMDRVKARAAAVLAESEEGEEGEDDG